MIANAFALGARLCNMKPFDINMVLARIKQVKGSYKYKNINRTNPASKIRKSYGFPHDFPLNTERREYKSHNMGISEKLNIIIRIDCIKELIKGTI